MIAHANDKSKPGKCFALACLREYEATVGKWKYFGIAFNSFKAKERLGIIKLGRKLPAKKPFATRD